MEEGSTQEFLRESFKLADPGFATFEPRLDVDARPKKKIDGGTSTYGEQVLKFVCRHGAKHPFPQVLPNATPRHTNQLFRTLIRGL